MQLCLHGCELTGFEEKVPIMPVRRPRGVYLDQIGDRRSSPQRMFNMITFEKRRDRNSLAMAQLRAIASPTPYDLKKIYERDAVLKLVLLLPEDVLGQALAVGRALQACAEHRRTSLAGPTASYQTPPESRDT